MDSIKMDVAKAGGIARRLRPVIALTLAAALAFPVPAIAQHDGFHKWSVAREFTGGAGFTGVHVYRIDEAATGVPKDGCSTPNIGHPVYQSQWVIMNDLGTNWVELGTGHQCKDQYRYWFWGYGINGDFTLVGHQTGITNGVWHFFKIERLAVGGLNHFQFRIDGVLKGSYINAGSGPRVEAGLESYAIGATVAGHNYTTLQYQKWGGLMYNWSGMDQGVIDPPLCGQWVSAISWRAGQGAGQC